MLVPVRSLLGLVDVPLDHTSAKRWLIRAGVTVTVMDDDGRRPEAVDLCDLPEDVQHAWTERGIARAGLEPGERDAEAQERFLEATPAMRSAALRRAGIARFLVVRRGHMRWGWLVRATQERFGAKGTSDASLCRILKQIERVAPINFAPALVHDYAREGGRRCWLRRGPSS